MWNVALCRYDVSAVCVASYLQRTIRLAICHVPADFSLQQHHRRVDLGFAISSRLRLSNCSLTGNALELAWKDTELASFAVRYENLLQAAAKKT